MTPTRRTPAAEAGKYKTPRAFAKALAVLLERCPDGWHLVGVDDGLHLVSRAGIQEIQGSKQAHQRGGYSVADYANRDDAIRIQDPHRIYYDSGGA